DPRAALLAGPGRVGGRRRARCAPRYGQEPAAPRSRGTATHDRGSGCGTRDPRVHRRAPRTLAPLDAGPIAPREGCEPSFRGPRRRREPGSGRLAVAKETMMRACSLFSVLILICEV